MFEDMSNKQRAKEMLSRIKQLAEAINVVLQNQEDYVNAHNEHEDRLEKIEKEIEKWKTKTA